MQSWHLTVWTRQRFKLSPFFMHHSWGDLRTLISFISWVSQLINLKVVSEYRFIVSYSSIFILRHIPLAQGINMTYTDPLKTCMHSFCQKNLRKQLPPKFQPSIQLLFWSSAHTSNFSFLETIAMTKSLTLLAPPHIKLLELLSNHLSYLKLKIAVPLFLLGKVMGSIIVKKPPATTIL